MIEDPQAWVAPWARWAWGLLFLAMVLLELATVAWNYYVDDGRRANLTAFVRAYYGVGDRRLKRKGRVGAMVAVFVLGLLHFLGYF